jgi:hypothetical protein
LATGLAGIGQGNGAWENSVGSQLYQHHNEIIAIANHIGLDESALAGLIGQSKLDSSSISLLQAYSTTLFQDMGDLSNQVDGLNTTLITMQGESENQMSVIQSQNDLLKAQNTLLKAQLTEVQATDQARIYQDEHSGVGYCVETFFVSIGDWFGNIPKVFNRG